MSERFRSSSDVAFCRAIHRRYGTTYYFATLRFPPEIRWRVHGLYAFVRVPDEWVDNPGELTGDERRQRIEVWRDEMVRGMQGERPSHPAMRVFCDAARDTNMPLEEAHCFLDAMIMDLTVTRYETYDDLRGYMRGSAAAVGVMMCYAMGAKLDAETLERAKSLGDAMQLTNFLRDVDEDWQRGRIYLPMEELRRFGVTESDLEAKRVSPAFLSLMQFQCERARGLYRYADPGIPLLPPSTRKAVLLARILYSAILQRIEIQGYDVFAGRARTCLGQKLVCALMVALRSEQILKDLIESRATITPCLKG